MSNATDMITSIAASSKIPDMSDQEVFDIVATHLFAQGKRSLKVGAERIGTCAYRGADGLKCAIGILIPDAIYQKKWDDCSNAIDTLLDRATKALRPLHTHSWLLEELQNVHDMENYWLSTEQMHDALEDVAERHLLTIDNISTLSFDNSKHTQSIKNAGDI